MTLGVVAGGLFLAVMSTTTVSVALPTIGRNLRVGPTGLEWIVDAYVVIYASLLVPGGALGNRIGRKGLFLVGVALFASVLLLGRDTHNKPNRRSEGDHRDGRSESANGHLL